MKYRPYLIGRSVRKIVLKAESAFRLVTGIHEPEEKLVADNQSFWEDGTQAGFEQNSHWRGRGPFADDKLWLALGESHWKLFELAADWTGLARPLKKTVAWGCGGGMNAIHFAPMSEDFYGVDISEDSLAECGRQLEEAGQANFSPVLVNADEPEAAINVIGTDCDAFVCTYVFELLPSPEYCARILRIAHGLLKQNGVALIQIRYSGQTKRTGSRGWRYAQNMTKMCTFEVEEFWNLCAEQGLDPLFVKLVPLQPELNEQRYAYFALQKRG